MAKRKIKKASVFIDLETLGNYDDAVILSMGLTILTDDMQKKPGLTFADFMGVSYEYKYAVMEQVKEMKRSILKQTFEWWKKQEGPAAEASFKPSPNDRSLKFVFEDMKEAIAKHGLTIEECRFWDRNAYDMKKLAHVAEVTLNMGPFPPWDYQEVWGIETLLRFMSPQESRYGSIEPNGFTDPLFVYHKPSCDAALDAYRFYKLTQGE